MRDEDSRFEKFELQALCRPASHTTGGEMRKQQPLKRYFFFPAAPGGFSSAMA
jgi:hypothetical protein